MIESKSIIKFKKQIITALPFFPNTKEVKEELEAMHIRDVMLHYVHWRSRLIPSRKRKVQISSEVTSDKRWKANSNAIKHVLGQASLGVSLGPFHSVKAHEEGYSPFSSLPGNSSNTWIDKDFLLNAYGLYHLHLSPNIGENGLCKRTNEIVFCYVNREMIRAVGIFNHDVFSDKRDDDGFLTNERTRLLKLSEQYESMGRTPGSIYISNMITTSGHPLFLSTAVNNYFNYMRNNDANLNERGFVNTLFGLAGREPPEKFKLSWEFWDLDFGIVDSKNKIFFPLFKGHI